jgi:hypothetical protein
MKYLRKKKLPRPDCGTEHGCCWNEVFPLLLTGKETTAPSVATSNKSANRLPALQQGFALALERT